MSKKNSIILILFVFLLIFGGLLFFYFYSGNTQTKNTPVEGNTPSNPFGSNTTSRTSTTTQPNQNNNYNNTNKNQNALRQLYAYPISGSVIFEKNDNTNIRFVDRATGNVHEILSNSEETKRITNTTIPKILEAVWGNTGDALILRYSVNDDDKIDNFSAKIKPSNTTDTGEIVGKVVYQNADQIITNPSGTKSFGLTKIKNMGGSYGVISSIDGTNNKQIFSSEISDWLISWPKDNVISFVTKPSYQQEGLLFFLNTDNSSFQKVFGGALGMTALVSKDTTKVIYSDSSRKSLRLNYYDVKTEADKNLQVATISDKCVWSNKDKETIYCAVPKYIPGNNYPDAWYQGIVSLSDNFWKIDVEQGTTELIYETGINESINVDAMDLKINSSDDYLIFTDKNNLSLWGLKI